LTRSNRKAVALESEVAAAEETAQDREHLVHPASAPLPGHPRETVVLGPRAQSDAEREAVLRERRHAGHLLGDEDRVADGKLDDERMKPESRRDRAERRREAERIEEWLVLEEPAVTVGRVGVLAVGHLGVGHAVGERHGVKPRLLGRARERRVMGDVAHGLGEGEAHLAPMVWSRRGARP